MLDASDRETVYRRVVSCDVARVFAAWTRADLFARWWVPESMGASLASCEMDVRVGGKYRLVFAGIDAAFHGEYLEVEPNARLVWTNEEAGEQGPVTTVIFEAVGDKTLVVLQERHPSAAAFQAAGGGAGTAEMLDESFTQLERLLGGAAESRAGAFGG